jgi:hypothetical protein
VDQQTNGVVAKEKLSAEGSPEIDTLSNTEPSRPMPLSAEPSHPAPSSQRSRASIREVVEAVHNEGSGVQDMGGSNEETLTGSRTRRYISTISDSEETIIG